MKPLPAFIVAVLFIIVPIVAAQDNSRLRIDQDNAANLRLLHTISLPGVQSVAWSPDASTLAIGSTDSLQVVDATGHTRRWQRASEGVTQVSWSYNNQMLAALYESGKVTVFDAATGTREISISTAAPSRAVFSPTEALLAYNDGSRLYVASMQFGSSTRQWQMPANIRDIQWTPDGEHLAVVVQRGVIVWDINAEREVYRLLPETDTRVERVNWRPAPMALTTIAQDTPAIALYDSPGNAIVTTYSGHADTVRSIDWSPDGTLLASVGADERLLLWDAERGLVLSEHRIAAPRHVVWAPDSRQVVTVALDEVGFWGVLNEGAESVAAAP